MTIAASEQDPHLLELVTLFRQRGLTGVVRVLGSVEVLLTLTERPYETATDATGISVSIAFLVVSKMMICRDETYAHMPLCPPPPLFTFDTCCITSMSTIHYRFPPLLCEPLPLLAPGVRPSAAPISFLLNRRIPPLNDPTPIFMPLSLLLFGFESNEES